MSAIPLNYMNAVAAVGYRRPDGKVKYTGSGFVYGVDARPDSDDERAYYSFVVTNCHVVAPLDKPFVRQSYLPTVEKPHWTNVRGDCPKSEWTLHPDEKIDVAVYPVHTPDRGLGPEAFYNDIDVLDPFDMAEIEFREGSEIYVLGFPLGLVDASNNYVIARQGIVARILDWYEGISRAYLIDSLNYPGNSGGPVITKHNSRLVGMVSAYLPFQDIARSQQTSKPMMSTYENSGLAIVMPPSAIEETIELALGREFVDAGRKTENDKNGHG